MNDIQVSDNILYLNSRVLTESEQSLVEELVHVLFFISIFFRDQARICLVKIWKEAQIMLVICLLSLGLIHKV